MTVRLRLSCEDDTREVSLERRSISIGRGPFNDVVFSEADIERVHGVLEIDESGGIAFRARAQALPTR
ncbi:MAG: FHA domain-containing protein, partial [Persicimonas sp.]